MARKFAKGDLVIRKNIGVVCMEVYDEDFDFDDEAQAQGMRGMFKAIGSTDIPEIPEEEQIKINDESHHIYKVGCKWHDPTTGEERRHTFLKNELEFCSTERPWKTIEGFKKKS